MPKQVIKNLVHFRSAQPSFAHGPGPCSMRAAFLPCPVDRTVFAVTGERLRLRLKSRAVGFVGGHRGSAENLTQSRIGTVIVGGRVKGGQFYFRFFARPIRAVRATANPPYSRARMNARPNP